VGFNIEGVDPAAPRLLGADEDGGSVLGGGKSGRTMSSTRAIRANTLLDALTLPPGHASDHIIKHLIIGPIICDNTLTPPLRGAPPEPVDFRGSCALVAADLRSNVGLVVGISIAFAIAFASVLRYTVLRKAALRLSDARFLAVVVSGAVRQLSAIQSPSAPLVGSYIASPQNEPSIPPPTRNLLDRIGAIGVHSLWPQSEC